MVHSLIQTINLIVPNLSELSVWGNKLEDRADDENTSAPESLTLEGDVTL